MVKSDRKLKWQRFDPETLAHILPEIQEEMERHCYEIPLEIQEQEIFQQSEELFYAHM